MKLYYIALFITAVTTFYIHNKNLMPMRKARHHMLEAIRNKGGDPAIWGVGLGLTMLNDPYLILKGADDAEMHALKIDFINKWQEARKKARFTLVWAACGCAITIIIGALETML